MSLLREASEQALSDPAVSAAWDALAEATVRPAVEALLQDGRQPQLPPAARALVLELVGPEQADKWLPQVPRDPKLLLMPYMAPEVRADLDAECRALLAENVQGQLDKPAVRGARDAFAAAFAKTCRRVVGDTTCRAESALAPRGHAADLLASMLVDNLRGHGFALPLADQTSAAELVETEGHLGARPDAPTGLVQDGRTWRANLAANRAALLGACAGRSLPPSMRRYLFGTCFLGAKAVEECSQELARSLATRAAPGAAGQPQRATHSRIHALLSRLVRESFRTNLVAWRADGASPDSPHGPSDRPAPPAGLGSDGIRSAAQRQERREELAGDVLNQYYVMSGQHVPALLSLLVPLLSDFDGEPGMDAVALTAMLAAVHASLPIRGGAAEVAKRIWSGVLQRDPELTAYIRRLLEEYRAKHAQLGSPLAAAVDEDYDLELQPHSLVLPWVEHALVGFLRPNAVQYVWCQCLLRGAAAVNDDGSAPAETWDNDRFVAICVEVFLLLRGALVSLQSVSELHRAMRERPLALLTSEIRRCTQSKGSPLAP